MNNKTLMTDFYELTMGQTYFDEGKQDEKVVFDIFFRKNPFNGGYTISGGLDETIKFIENFHFGEKEIEYEQLGEPLPPDSRVFDLSKDEHTILCLYRAATREQREKTLEFLLKQLHGEKEKR